MNDVAHMDFEDQGLKMAKIICFSFFDEMDVDMPVFNYYEDQKFSIENEEFLLDQLILYKKQNKKEEYKKCYFFVTNSGLYYVKQINESKKYQYKYMPFHKTRSISIDKSYKKNSEINYKYGFHFFRNQNTIQLLTNDSKTYEDLKKIIVLKTIQHTFHEEFEVKKLIGKGSFAKVYLAKKNATNEEYAVKAFSKEILLGQANGKESLLNEIDIMRKLSHPNILKLYEVFETEHSIYLVIDLLQGGDFVSRINESQTFDSKTIGLFLKNLLEAINHMHQRKIMHRDLKPDNLLIRDMKDITDLVIADFGLSTKIDIPISEMIFKRCGTPGFVAPEILHYKDNAKDFYSEKCDIFSIGAIFYLILTKKKLFDGANCSEILSNNKECEIDFSSSNLANCDKLALELLKKMLHIFPEARISASKALMHPYFDNVFKGTPEKKKKEGLNIPLKNDGFNLIDYHQMSPLSPSKQAGSPLVMNKTLLTGKTTTIEKFAPGFEISPKKGGKNNVNFGFSEMTKNVKGEEEIKNENINQKPRNQMKKISLGQESKNNKITKNESQKSPSQNKKN